MYKIGYTSGLAEKSSDEGKTTIKIIGDVLPKMIKKVEDCPKKALAINKIMEITDGCFSSASCIEVKDEKSSSSSSDSENSEDSDAESAESEAAQTSGSCGGGRSSSCNNSSNNSATKSSCNGGCSGGSSCSGSTSSQNELTGEDLVDMYTPSEITDIIDSDCATVLESNINAAASFKRQYCNYRPYPECATCPYASGNIGTTSNDLTTIFSQVRDAMQALESGQYELADHMFQCPGQLALLLSGEIEDEAKVAAARAVYAVVELAASRGALSTFANVATEALATDFRREIMYAASDLLQSGSNIAQTKGFVNAMNGILTVIGCTGNSLTRLRSGSGSSRSSRFGAGYNLCGRRSNGTKNSNTRAKTLTNTSRTSRVTGKSVDYGIPSATDTSVNSGIAVNVMGAGEVADTDDSIIPTVYNSGSRKPVSAESTAKAEKALAKVSESLTKASDVSDSPLSNTVKPASKSNKYTATKSTTTEVGKTYYKAVKDSTTDSGVKYVAIATTAGEDIESLETKYGSIYEKDDSTNADAITEVADVRIITGREYFYYNPINDEYVSIDTTPGELVENIRRKVAIKLGINKSSIKVCCRTKDETNVDYELTKDIVPVSGVSYFIVDTTGNFVSLDTSSGSFPTGSIVYEKVENPIGYTTGCNELKSTGAYLQDNGLMLEESVPVDICNDTLSVDTRTLVTQTHVLAEDIAQIDGLGMSVYEVKMAYLLDHEQNGSIMPVDVTGEVVSTILDTIANND